MKIVTVIFFFLSFLLPILTHADCDCETDDKDRNKTHVTPLKIGAIFSILAGGGVGVSLHTLGKWLSFLRPEKDIFFAFKAFAAGVILATSFIHILPNAFEKLTSPCLMSSPWQDFPFAGFCAMVAVIGMSVVETVATGYYNNRVKGGKVMGEVKMVSDEEKAGEVHDSHRIDGHVHGHDMINYDDDDTVMRHKVVSQVLELAIVMHSVILGVSLGASDRPTIKTMMISLSFHQFFEGIGLGGCLVQEWFYTYKTLDGGVVIVGDNHACRTIGIGSVLVRMHDGAVRELREVRHVPEIRKNLLSVGAFESKGYKLVIFEGVLKISKGALVFMRGVRHHNQYYLQGKTVTGSTAVAQDSEDATKLWHMRLSHAGEPSLFSLHSRGLIKGKSTCKLDFCEHSVYDKKTRVSFGTDVHNTKGILYYVHTDVWGPTKMTSFGGCQYFVSFIDDFSRFVWVYTMKRKSEVLEKFMIWRKLVENQTGRLIRCIRSDNGGEYTSDAFLRECQNAGIDHHFTVRETPQQNGVAERMNRILVEKVRCMLSNAGMDIIFWAESMDYACHLVNRLPSAAIGKLTPMEKWSGHPPRDYEHLKFFGCPAYYHVRNDKLEPRAQKAVFLGFRYGVKGYKLFDHTDKKIVISRDVTFDEASMLKPHSSQQVESSRKATDGLQTVELGATPFVTQYSSNEQHEPDQIVADDEPRDVDQEHAVEEEVADIDETPVEESIVRCRTRRKDVPKPLWLKDHIEFSLSAVEAEIPSHFKEAVERPEAEQWKQAMEEEMQSLLKNDMWRLVKFPPGRKAIGCKWVYGKKVGSLGEADVRFKARLVAKGFAQQKEPI